MPLMKPWEETSQCSFTLNPQLNPLVTLLIMLSRFHTFEKASIAQRLTHTKVLLMQKNLEQSMQVFAILMLRWKACNSCFPLSTI